MIRLVVEETRKEGMPMLMIRWGVEAASLVWMVDRTRWPVMAAWVAISAVSLSRISPTMMMFGSCLKIDRRPLAKVNSILGLTWLWLIRGMRYSIGSSMVEMFTWGLFRTFMMV